MHWAYTVAAYPVSSMQSWSATRRCGSGVEDIDHGSVQTGHAVVPCGCARHGAGLKTAHEPAETAVGRYARMVTNTYQQLSSGTPPCLCRLLRVGQVAEGWRPQHQTDLRYHEIESQTSSQDCSKSTKTPTWQRSSPLHDVASKVTAWWCNYCSPTTPICFLDVRAADVGHDGVVEIWYCSCRPHGTPALAVLPAPILR
eukprot:m.1631347 g.1631347  ORF g.1631347 m.1631347 type:complete len:199 (+) comp25403_c0_seq14:2629-3225(+)